MMYSNKFKIIISVMIIMMLSSGLANANLEPSNDAQRAGYHSVLHTFSLVNFNNANSPIVVNRGLISGDNIAINAIPTNSNHVVTIGYLNNLGSGFGSLWTETSLSCIGAATSCSSLTGTACSNQIGCSWVSTGLDFSCIDSPGASSCSTLNQAQCGTTINNGQLGCMWGVGLYRLNSNVGIGTSSPSYRLDVAGNARITGATRIEGTLNMNNNRIINLASPTDLNHAATRGFVETAIANALSGGSGGGTVDGSKWTNGTGDNIYRLNGNIGVGTSSPEVKLDVIGNLKATRVGVGVSNPLALLHVKGSTTGFCSGTATSCDSLYTYPDCDKQLDCTYVFDGDCSLLPDWDCNTYSGCSLDIMGGGCDGTYTQCTGFTRSCTGLSQTNCNTQIGCKWNTLSAFFEDGDVLVKKDLIVEGKIFANFKVDVTTVQCPTHSDSSKCYAYCPTGSIRTGCSALERSPNNNKPVFVRSVTNGCYCWGESSSTTDSRVNCQAYCLFT
jgi:hypothetical protein